MVGDFTRQGWLRFGPEAAVAGWAAAALASLKGRPLTDLRLGGTWDVGLEALPNDAAGAVSGVPLAGRAAEAARALAGNLPLHRAQVSTVLPGYPQPSPDESAAAFAYRRDRDSAHVDGILPIGSEKRRMVREPHAWILGLPLTNCGPGASPLVVWDGSHRIMGRAFAAALGGVAEEDRPFTDITDAYQAARREVFASCARIELHNRAGEAVLLHRHALHGIGPWQDGAEAPPEGRIVAYFRPLLPTVGVWAAT
ncbi:MAG: hypothetical protein LCH69_10265 [Proteobacteria bacterium]|nr:hypothetical protein [Pseudomonadota bacterium]